MNPWWGLEDIPEVDHSLRAPLRESGHPGFDEGVIDVGRGGEMGEVGVSLGLAEGDVVVGTAHVAEVLELRGGGEGGERHEEQEREQAELFHGDSFLEDESFLYKEVRFSNRHAQSHSRALGPAVV